MIPLALALLLSQADVRLTRHNLASTSANPVRAVSEGQVCVFCHVPHGASQSRATWNKDLGYQLGGSLYTLYGSSTLDAVPGRPSGASKLCLSCHDGSLALGSLADLGLSRPGNVTMRNGTTTMPVGASNLGVDLRDDHPVSFTIDPADPEVHAPAPGDAVKLQEGASAVKDSVECTSCHDPHLSTGKFLVKQDARGALCTSCHTRQGWVGSAHEQSAAPYPATGTATVGDAACRACHKPHGAEGRASLLTTENRSGPTPYFFTEEAVCIQCHRQGGTGVDPATSRAAPDLESRSFKPAGHPDGLMLDEHKPAYTARQPPPEPVLNPSRHVECVDCHNPHQARRLPGNVHEGMRGISLSGAVVVDDATTDLKQYEVCFRCHGDTFSTFVFDGSNKRLEFQPTNDSYHPVAAPGRNQSSVLNNATDTPSGQLRGLDATGAPLNRFSTILCTDCHNSEETTDVLGSARSSAANPKGPHGSDHAAILRANYDTTTGVNAAPYPSFNPTHFALCFLCHDGQRLLTFSTNFVQPAGVGAGQGNLHRLHLQTRTFASCAECHGNVHANNAAANTDFRNTQPGASTHLINFAPTVKPWPGTDPYFGDVPTKPRYGRTPGGDMYCLVSCHGNTTVMDGVRSVYRPGP
ncbi:MAG: cytochrome c3 family protein [Myxococcota bacterium]